MGGCRGRLGGGLVGGRWGGVERERGGREGGSSEISNQLDYGKQRYGEKGRRCHSPEDGEADGRRKGEGRVDPGLGR